MNVNKWLGFAAIVSLSVSNLAHSESIKGTYNEPTRGFFIEHGVLAGAGKASLELHTAVGTSNSNPNNNQDDFTENGGGIRLGLENLDILVNSGVRRFDGNEIMAKIPMRPFDLDKENEQQIDWTVNIGVSHTDVSDGNSGSERDLTNIKIGSSLTTDIGAFTFTAAPSLIMTTGSVDEDNFIDAYLGAYAGLIEKEYGLFSAGAEFLYTTQDDVDPSIALGLRWAYNDRVNLDFIPILLGEDDRTGIPGLIRLNLSL